MEELAQLLDVGSLVSGSDEPYLCLRNLNECLGPTLPIARRWLKLCSRFVLYYICHYWNQKWGEKDASGQLHFEVFQAIEHDIL